MKEAKQNIQKIKVDADLITDTDYDLGCSILASSVRCFFERPGIKEEYEKWLKKISMVCRCSKK